MMRMREPGENICRLFVQGAVEIGGFRLKSLWFLFVVSALLCLCLQGCMREEAAHSISAEDLGRARLRTFWQLYGEATQLRIAGAHGSAAERYLRALENNPSHEDSLYYLAGCYAALGRYDQAVAYYQKLVTVNPASHRGHFQLGITLSTPLPGATLDFARARQAFLRNIEINQEESGPFLRLGELALIQGKIEDATQFFDTASGFQSPEGLFRAGFVRYLVRDYPGALSRFRRVLDINAREKKISGRGVHSEGDVRSSEDRLNPLERAGILALIYGYWTSRKLGGYPADIPTAYRMRAPDPPAAPFSFSPFRPAGSKTAAVTEIPSVRDLWTRDWQYARDRAYARKLHVDLDNDGHAERVEAGAGAILITGKRFPRLAVPGSPVVMVDVAALDYDGDGFLDLVGLEWKRGLRLFRNTGNRSFEEVTASSGLPSDAVESFALATLDSDRDGCTDILLTRYAPHEEALLRLTRPAGAKSEYALRLFRNTSAGRFDEVRDLPGLDAVHGVVRALAADFDGDGFPDLFLACGSLDGSRLEPSVVLRNLQGRGFAVAAYLPRFDDPVRALGAQVLDLDGDGRPDICLRTAEGLRLFRNLPAS